MPTTIGYSFGDIVLVPFPFTDQSTSKKRPAIVVSSDAYHRQRGDIILAAVTSQIRPTASVGECALVGWQSAGLLKPSVMKPVLATVDRGLVLRKLGALQEQDRANVRVSLLTVLGE